MTPEKILPELSGGSFLNNPVYPSGLLLGSSLAFHLSHLIVWRGINQGHRVTIVDCAIRFNVFKIAGMASSSSLPASELLHRIHICRAFTPYQILDAIDTHAKPHMPLILLAPCKQFLDGDVAGDEALFLLDKMADKLRNLSLRGISLLIAEKDNYQSPVFRSFLPRFKNVPSRLWQVDSEGGLTLERKKSIRPKNELKETNLITKRRTHGTHPYPLLTKHKVV